MPNSDNKRTVPLHVNTWFEVEPLFRWVRSINRIASSSDMPTISGPTALIASDYSGERRADQYQVYSFLVIDLERAKEWSRHRRNIRSVTLRDGRRMAYKNLNDRQRLQALQPFLRAADSLTGLCFSIAVHRSITSLCEADLLYEHRERMGLTASWHSRSFERALRIVNFMCVLTAGLTRPGQNVYWISDDDAIFGSPAHASDVAELCSHFGRFYMTSAPGELGLGTTQLDEGDRLEEDFAAIPDLVAGALVDLLNTLRGKDGAQPIGGLHRFVPRLPRKTELLIDWIFGGAKTLKKLSVGLDRELDGRISVRRFDVRGNPL